MRKCYKVIKNYCYIGNDPHLIGATALGQEIDGVFKVQVDSFYHQWSRSWHETPCEDWAISDA